MPSETASGRDTFDIECSDRSVREINRAIREAAERGVGTIRLLNPAARHNLGVALPEGIHLIVEGSAGYYPAGLNDGATVEIHGSVGWGAAESMREGLVVIDGNAGNALGATIRSGTVIVRGDASTRAGIAMKGGILLVAGDVGPMSGFMMQKGSLIVCGDAGDGLADSMYEGTVFIAGRNGELGADAVEQELTEADKEMLGGLLERSSVPCAPSGFRKLVAGRKLWNFQHSELKLWKSVL